MEEALTLGQIDELMVEKIEPSLKALGPAFLYDYPASLAALSRLKNHDSDVAERFELYIGGLEVANAFSELRDADEQALRFEKERQKQADFQEKLKKISYNYVTGPMLPAGQDPAWGSINTCQKL